MPNTITMGSSPFTMNKAVQAIGNALWPLPLAVDDEIIKSNFDNQTTRFAVAPIDATRFIIVYADTLAGNYATAVVATINQSTKAVTLGTPKVFYNVAVQAVDVIRHSSGKLIAVCAETTSRFCMATILDVQPDGTITNYTSVKAHDTYFMNGDFRVEEYDSGRILICGLGGATTSVYYPLIITMTLNGATLIKAGDYLNSTAATNFAKAFRMKNKVLLIKYSTSTTVAYEVFTIDAGGVLTKTFTGNKTFTVAAASYPSPEITPMYDDRVFYQSTNVVSTCVFDDVAETLTVECADTTLSGISNSVYTTMLKLSNSEIFLINPSDKNIAKIKYDAVNAALQYRICKTQLPEVSTTTSGYQYRGINRRAAVVGDFIVYVGIINNDTQTYVFNNIAMGNVGKIAGIATAPNTVAVQGLVPVNFTVKPGAKYFTMPDGTLTSDCGRGSLTILGETLSTYVGYGISASEICISTNNVEQEV